jgi:PKD repeat protein
MEAHEMKASLPLLVVLCLSAAAAAFAGGPPPALVLTQPDFLSTTSETAILYRVTVPEGGPGLLTVRLSTEDGLLDEEVCRAPVTLKAGDNEGRFLLAPAQLRSVNVHEDVTLTASMRLGDGSELADDLDSTVAPGEPSPEGGTWGVVLASKPALVYTNKDTILHYTVTNPKAETKKVGLYLKFMNDKKKKKVKLTVTLHPDPGVNDMTVLVPSSIATQALSKGDTILKTVLKVEGIVKKKDQALLDYNFFVTASADPATGSAPLEVHFTGDATGGKLPYAFGWDFNDGGTSSEANPTHTYPVAGTYIASLAVSDSLGATVGATATVTVSIPPLVIESCTASPTSGTVPVAVTFGVVATGGSSAYTYSWNFGDGASSALQNPTHTYTAPGSYAGVVTVTSGGQQASCTTPTITLTCQTLAVQCSGAPQTVPVGGTVSFQCLAVGGDGTYVYSWDFGDGFKSAAQNPAHIYQTAGTFHPTVTVTSCSQSKLCTGPTIAVQPQ